MKKNKAKLDQFPLDIKVLQRKEIEPYVEYVKCIYNCENIESLYTKRWHRG